MYLVPKEIKSKPKVTQRLYVFDFMFLLGYAVLSYMLGTAVSTPLRIPFYLFSAVMALMMISPSPKNAHRRKYQEAFTLVRHLLDDNEYKWEG